LKAETIPAVKVPEELDNSRLGQLYRLPDQDIVEPTSAKTPFPPASATQASGQSASLQQLDNKLWVLNDRSVATTWVQLINFWNRRGVTLEKTDVKDATLQTGWFNEAIQPGFSIRYRLRLEQGFQDNTSEIYLSNQKRDNSNLAGEWINNQNDVGDDRVHAQLIADSLVTQLINGQSDVGNSFLAESINLPQKSSLSIINNEPVLLLAVNTPRANNALSKALADDGFLTYDSDLASGFFHFDQYEVGKKGFLSFFSRSKSSQEDSVPNKKSKFSIEQIVTHLPKDPIVNELFFDDKSAERKDLPKLSGVPGFLLVVKPQDDSQLVYVRDGYGKMLESEEAKDILDVIRLRLF
jgi:uncharacterized lipoprotein